MFYRGDDEDCDDDDDDDDDLDDDDDNDNDLDNDDDDYDGPHTKFYMKDPDHDIYGDEVNSSNQKPQK